MTQATAAVRYLTTEELAERFRATSETVRYWRHVGKGPRSVKFGRRVLYPIEDVLAWEGQAREAAGAAPAGQ